jgi:hypothetical protein
MILIKNIMFSKMIRRYKLKGVVFLLYIDIARHLKFIVTSNLLWNNRSYFFYFLFFFAIEFLDQIKR